MLNNISLPSFYRIKSLIRIEKLGKGTIYKISNEFYNFLIVLVVWILYIWFFTLRDIDTRTLPLRPESISQISSANFEETISNLSPHFAEFEINCAENALNYTLDLYTFITSVLFMDWTYRLIYLFIFYQIFLYLENKFNVGKLIIQTKTKTPMRIKQTIVYRLRFIIINTLLYFFFGIMDVTYNQLKYGNNQNNTLQLKDYSNFTIFEEIMNIIYIFVRVHPLDSWLIRLSHCLSYPFTLFAISRPNVSSFVYVHLLTIVFGIWHFGGICHILDYDMQLRCVRRSFLWSIRTDSLHFEAIRQTIAPYLNVVCLTIDCAKYVF